MLVVMSDKIDPDGSGINVYPKLPIPKAAREGTKKPTAPDSGSLSMVKVLAALFVAAAIGGGAGYFFAPGKGAELTKVRKELAAAQTASKVEKDRADGAAQRVAVLEKDKGELEQKLSEVSARAGEMEKKVADANAAAEKKLKDAIDKNNATVSTEGDEIHLKLVDKVLFAVGDDQLTEKGKGALDKIAKALNDLPDKQVWVQGHTDDQPIVVPPPPKKKKGAKEAPPAPMVRFASNWELSAARALQVVHYLQDHGKVDPTRLAALAVSEYRPVSKSNKAANRRIEIVLYPHKAVIERAKK
jgi:chemotaxis protein MotB